MKIINLCKKCHKTKHGKEVGHLFIAVKFKASPIGKMVGCVYCGGTGRRKRNSVKEDRERARLRLIEELNKYDGNRLHPDLKRILDQRDTIGVVDYLMNRYPGTHLAKVLADCHRMDYPKYPLEGGATTPT